MIFPRFPYCATLLRLPISLMWETEDVTISSHSQQIMTFARTYRNYKNSVWLRAICDSQFVWDLRTVWLDVFIVCFRRICFCFAFVPIH